MRTLIAYRTASQMERKATQEARAAGHRAYLPMDKTGQRQAPTARGYVFSEGKPHDAKHIKNAIGQVARNEVRRLYLRTSKKQHQNAFQVGDRVWSASNYPGTVVQVHGRERYDVAVVIAHKTCVVKMKGRDMFRAHPHT